MMTAPQTLVKYIEANKDKLVHNKEIFEILEGDLLGKIQEKLRGLLV